MKIEDDELVFHSEIGHYRKEENGIKPNTVRVFDWQVWERIQRQKPTKIRIQGIDLGSREEGDEHLEFSRAISDITMVGELAGKVIVIISWYQEGERIK